MPQQSIDKRILYNGIKNRKWLQEIQSNLPEA